MPGQRKRAAGISGDGKAPLHCNATECPPGSSRRHPAEGMHTLVRGFHSRTDISSALWEWLGLRIQTNSWQSTQLCSSADGKRQGCLVEAKSGRLEGWALLHCHTSSKSYSPKGEAAALVPGPQCKLYVWEGRHAGQQHSDRCSGTQPALPPNAARRIRPHFYPTCLNSSTKLQYHLPANSPFHLHSAEVRWNFLTPDPGQNFTMGRAGLPSCSVMFSVAQSSPCLLVLRSRQAGS